MLFISTLKRFCHLLTILSIGKAVKRMLKCRTFQFRNFAQFKCNPHVRFPLPCPLCPDPDFYFYKSVNKSMSALFRARSDMLQFSHMPARILMTPVGRLGSRAGERKR